MFNIPESVRIGGIDYKISETNDVIVIDHKECSASVDYYNHIIKIKSDIQDKQGEFESLLHEIFHAIRYERNFEYDKCDDETITEELARGLYQVVADNPKLFININKEE